MKQRLSPKTDYVFTRLFSKKGNESMLINFLESILKTKINNIQVMQEARLARTSEENKYGRLDLKVTLDIGTIINVEMQMNNTDDIERRSAFYASKIMSEQLKKTEKYNEINDIIMINILNYNFLDVEEYHSQTITVLKDHRNYDMNNPVTYHYIELPKFRKAEPDMENTLYQWLTFIDNENKELVEMAVKKNREIKKANEEWEYLTGDEEIKRLEFLELKAALDYNSRLDYDRRMIAKEVREQVQKEIREEAKKEAREEVREEIKKEVRAEGKKEKAIEIAKRMLELGVPIDIIINSTELTEEEIKNIKP